jgi:hypothetical protein
VLLKMVVKSPALLPASGTGYTMALPKVLFDCVPMPKMREPFAVSDPPSGTEDS